MSRRVLCIVPYFPPVAITGTHRSRAVVRYLPSYGWQPVVVTMRRAAGDKEDPALLEGLPANLPVYRAPSPILLDSAVALRSIARRLTGRGKARDQAPEVAPRGDDRPASRSDDVVQGPLRRLVDWASWVIQVPDQGIGWIPTWLPITTWAAMRHDCRAIYSSAPRHSVCLIALLTKLLSGLPWIADFRDPWRVNPFRKIPHASLDRYDSWLESQVVHGADRVICNSEFVRVDFMERYPSLSDRFVTVPNGFDPEDFADLTPRRLDEAGRPVICHAGVFYGPRRPHPIFEALRLLKDRITPERWPRLLLLGPPSYEDTPLEHIAASYEVGDMVRVAGSVPHRQTLEFQRGSDILLLVGFSGPGATFQVPAKVYEYMGVDRPVLALAPRTSAIGATLENSGIRHEICDPDDAEQIAAGILRLVHGSADGASRSATVPGPGPGRYHRSYQVRQIAELLDETGELR